MKKSPSSTMKIKYRQAWNLIRTTFEEWDRDNAMQLAAAVAFYMVFSFAPVLILLVAAASTIFGSTGFKLEFMHQLRGVLSRSGLAMVRTVLENAQSASIAATLMGLGAMLFGATAVFVALQDALNQIWGVMVKPGNVIAIFFRKRLISFLMLLLIGILLLASTFLGVALKIAGNHVNAVIRVIPLLGPLQFGVSIVLGAIVFGIIFKVLPDVRISWADVWIGAIVTSLLFNLGRILIGVYLARSMVRSLYGAAGSFAVFLIWIYYSTQVFFIGAEFTQVYAKSRGTPIIPDKNAVSFRIQTYTRKD
jgi:membrane protein